MSASPDHELAAASPVTEARRYIPGSPERPAFYRRCRFLYGCLAPLVYRTDIEGLDRIPASGPVIVASNHLSTWDIPSVSYPAKRLFHFMAKAEYASNRITNWLFTNLEAFFVRRGEGDLQAIRDALAVLKAGQLLAIYPEGHRSDTHAMIAAHEGLALIAYKSGAPVVPVATWGSEQVAKHGRIIFRRATIHIRYGAPLRFIPAGKRATKDELVAATDHIMGTIAAMLPPAYRGVYAAQAEAISATGAPAAIPAGQEAGA